MQNKQETTLKATITGEIHLSAGKSLQLIKRDLLASLTFKNPEWQRKMKRGISLMDTPRERHAFRKCEDGSLIIARGAWRILRDIARKYSIVIDWDPQVIDAEQRPFPLQLRAQLRPYQREAIELAIRARGGVIVIPTGGGKTMVAMGLAAQLQTETLFIVHTRELLRQTVEAANRFLGIDVGIIGAGQWDPKPFTVALIQTLAKRDLASIRERFALVVVDEAHHAPAQSYFAVLPHFAARYRVALTATPYRKDGLHELLWLQFGEIVYRVKKKNLEQHGRLLSPQFFPVSTNFSFRYADNFSALITALCHDPKRHQLIIDTISRTHRKGGCSLVLTERVEHCKNLTKSLEKRELPVVMLHGQLSAKQRVLALDKLKKGEAEILVATLSLIGEGWDHPPLETLYLTVPNGNKTKTTQALGRILRPAPGKPQPRVFDFVDVKVSLLRHHWGIRCKVYGISPEKAYPHPPQKNSQKFKEEQAVNPKILATLDALIEGNFDSVASSLKKNS